MHDTIQVTTESTPILTTSGDDPMAIRWGINFVREKFIDVENAGFGILPFGKFFPVKRFQVPKAIHTVDDNPNMPMEKLVTVTAREAENYLGEMLSGQTFNGAADPHKYDWGGRFGFYGEEDIAKMEVISTTLLPSLPKVREIASTVLSHKCPGEDATDFADRQTCPTCWFDWIDSPACTQYMQEIATTGRDVEITDAATGFVVQKRVTPTFNELETARQLIRESLQRNIAATQATWGQIAKELEEGGRRGIDAYQNNLRKDIHADKAADAQLRQVREYAKAVGSNQPVATNNFSDEELAMIYAQRVASKASVQEIVVEPEMTEAQKRMAHARAQKNNKGE